VTNNRHEPWLLILELTTDLILASDALIEGLQGKLGVETLEEAAAESLRRADEYIKARAALIKYARAMNEVFE
jgi:hypothetical protein